MKEKMVIVLALVLLAGFGYLSAYLNSFRVATINSSEIIRNSQYGREISDELNKKRSELSQKIETAKTNDEKERYSAEFGDFQSQKEKEFTESVTNLVAQMAKKRGLDIVVNAQTTIYSKYDLTDDIIEGLDQETAKKRKPQ